ncbi:MAG: hypothetical protein Q9187_007860, partial [Circinaria calcarea]
QPTDEEAGRQESIGTSRIGDENPIPLETLGTTTPQDENANEPTPSDPDEQNTKTATSLHKEVNQ